MLAHQWDSIKSGDTVLLDGTHLYFNPLKQKETTYHYGFTESQKDDSYVVSPYTKLLTQKEKETLTVVKMHSCFMLLSQENSLRPASHFPWFPLNIYSVFQINACYKIDESQKHLSFDLYQEFLLTVEAILSLIAAQATVELILNYLSQGYVDSYFLLKNGETCFIYKKAPILLFPLAPFPSIRVQCSTKHTILYLQDVVLKYIAPLYPHYKKEDLTSIHQTAIPRFGD